MKCFTIFRVRKWYDCIGLVSAKNLSIAIITKNKVDEFRLRSAINEPDRQKNEPRDQYLMVILLKHRYIWIIWYGIYIMDHIIWSIWYDFFDLEWLLVTFINFHTWPDIIWRIHIGIVSENKRPEIDKFKRYMELIDSLSQRSRIPLILLEFRSIFVDEAKFDDF